MSDMREYDADVFVLVPHELANRLSHLPDDHRYGDGSIRLLERSVRASLDDCFTVHKRAYRCTMGGKVFYDPCAFVLVITDVDGDQTSVNIDNVFPTVDQANYLRTLSRIKLN